MCSVITKHKECVSNLTHVTYYYVKWITLLQKLDEQWNREDTKWRQHTVAIDTLIVEENEDISACQQQREAVNCWTRYEVDRKTKAEAGVPVRLNVNEYCRRVFMETFGYSYIHSELLDYTCEPLYGLPTSLRELRLRRGREK
jgi:hypothetical protein